MALHIRNRNPLFVSFLFSISIFFLFPLSVYAQNVETNSFYFKDILVPLVIFTLIGFLVTFGFVGLTSKRLKFIPLLLVYLMVCLWIQGNLIQYNLGSLDGHSIDWAACFRRIWIEILVWAAIFALFVLFRKKILHHIHSILLFLFFLFTLPSIFLLIKSNGSIQDKIYLDYSREFQFSENNVLVIILDDFRSDAFPTILETHPEYQETFRDFIFYEDALGGYPTTRPSIPLILSGEYYQNLSPVQDYLSSIEETTIPYQLKQQGFTVENYPYVPFFSSIYDNQTRRLPLKEQFAFGTQQLIISGIRYSPLAIKPFFVARYYFGVNYVHKDLVTFNEHVDEVEITTTKPLFKLIHLSGAHVPYSLDSSLDWNQGDYLEQAAGSLLPVKNLLEELQIAGVYDDSLVLIMGDHGNNDTEGSSSFPLANYSHPLLLAKAAGQQYEIMQTSSAPVTLGDIPRTIADETGIDAGYQGVSLFGDIPENRTRTYYYYTWNHDHWAMPYMPTFYEFEVTGPAKNAASWNYIGQFTDGVFVGQNNFVNSDKYNRLMGKEIIPEN